MQLGQWQVLENRISTPSITFQHLMNNLYYLQKKTYYMYHHIKTSFPQNSLSAVITRKINLYIKTGYHFHMYTTTTTVVLYSINSSAKSEPSFINRML
jgi:hypothetical protein